MSLTRWRRRPSPAPISSLQDEMNRMFEDFFGQPFGLAPERAGMPVIPALDVKEGETSVTVTAELPGVDSKDVEISVHDDVLEIKGTKSQEQEREDDNIHVVERSYGSFARRIVLPAEVDSDKAKASMDKGVLTLELPKLGPKPGKKTINIG